VEEVEDGVHLLDKDQQEQLIQVVEEVEEDHIQQEEQADQE
jgi:hypothetical protein